MERNLITAILGLALLCGCASAPPTPGAVRPLLDAFATLGLRCSDPKVDNVPSGLLQWSCRGTVRDASLTVVVDGDEAGVFEIVAQVPGGTDQAVARQVFADLIAATPPLAANRETTDLQIQQDATWITLAIVPRSPPGFPPGER